MSRHARLVGLCLALFALNEPCRAQITDDAVRQALDRGTRYLKSRQLDNGSWPNGNYPGYPAGVTGISLLALLNAGLSVDDPAVSRGLAYLGQESELDKTYTVALQTMVFCIAEPKKNLFQIRRNVSWLQRAQRSSGPKKGGWGYSPNGDTADNSNSQFALLALYEAERAGVPASDVTWRAALNYWRQQQEPDGSFPYGLMTDATISSSTGSMTCAGIASLIIASGQVSALDAKVAGRQVDCCSSVESQDERVQRGIDWLARNFSVRENPSALSSYEMPRMYHYYYLYALERVGRMAGRRFIGDHDWYREGAEVLVELQDVAADFWNAKDPIVSTAFSVLFLAKGRRPTLISKLKRDAAEDWNLHRHDMAHLTHYVEQRWKQDLTWQVIDWSAASAEELWQSPVLFLSGRDALDVALAEKESLRSYIEMGGFLLAENCCDGDAFDEDFRALMAELFPDSPLRLLPPEHPIWFAEQRVDPEYLRPLYGIDACCRTGVVYCPEDLSCYWELAVPQRSRESEYPAEVQAEIDACLAMGVNIVTYATGRQLREKLERPSLVSIDRPELDRARASLQVVKLDHDGGGNEAPSALSNALAVLRQQTRLPVSTRTQVLPPTDPSLPDYSLAFVHGRRAFRWNQAERKAVRRFIENGGFLFGDAICANEEFAASFREEMQAIFPDIPPRRIPPDHPLLTEQYHGHDVTRVTLRDPRARARRDDPLSTRTEQVAPLLEGIQWNGRFVVVFSPYDMSCALENQPSLECRGYGREDAAKIATNIVLYAMQQ